MKRWSVRVPFTGYVVVEVEAEDERTAIEAALESDLDMKNAEEASFHDQVVRGNVFYGAVCAASAEEIESDEEES